MKFIAEIGSNHNQNMDRLMKLIETAKDIGCSAIKLQMFDHRLGRAQEDRNKFAKIKLPNIFVSNVYHKCKDLEIDFHCTPFHPDFVKWLCTYVSEFKIGSYELLWLDLIEACAKTRKSIAISCGGGTLNEIKRAYYTARNYLPPELITLYHCIPHYPANPKDTQLWKIAQFNHVFTSSIIGYSDHTANLYTMLDAARAGAQEIEFHLDLDDGKGAEAHFGHCWKSADADKMIKAVRSINQINESLDSVLYNNMRKMRTDPKDGMRRIQDE